MDKTYNPKAVEEKIYRMWEAGGYFTAGEKEGKKPFVIIMPPPNANASLHAGHAMYTVEDVIIRWRRMQGYFALWVPGLDHAGIETQSVYEKFLAKQGKSRLDFDRAVLYRDIFAFVKENSGLIYTQFKTLGFSADWTRSTFSLDKKVLDRVFETFKKLHDEGLVYRDNYLVNYCLHCGTTLADLEVNYIERADPLYYVRYPLVNDSLGQYIVVATVRPEPIFVDTHLAVHPKDKKNAQFIGARVKNPLTDRDMEIIADDYVDPAFGTGIVKLTPAHDAADFQVAKKKNLPIIQAIDWTGRIMENGGRYKGLKVKIAREEVVNDLTKKGLIEKIDTAYLHSVPVCYRCKHDLEALIIPNWFVKVGELKKPAIKAVKEKKITFVPKRLEREYFQWMDAMRDWPISRQIVWGIRIPVWYKIEDRTNDFLWVWWLDRDNTLQQGTVARFLAKGVSIKDIENGLQKVSALPKPDGPDYVIAHEKPEDGDYLPETDTFDTWFSSGQWPLVTLNYPDGSDFKKFYPTDVVGTLFDILRFWISRMIMFGLYLTGNVPFKTVYFWSAVVDAKGQKMSKSKGNVINPTTFVDTYGADALRMAIIYGNAPGSRVPLSEDKVRGMRNFANKLWNMARFIELIFQQLASLKLRRSGSALSSQPISFYDEMMHKELKNPNDKRIISEVNMLVVGVTKDMEKYRFSDASQKIYDFAWHTLADVHIEKNKERFKEGDVQAIAVLRHVYFILLKLLHPFMPFVTEELYQKVPGWNGTPLIVSQWPG